MAKKEAVVEKQAAPVIPPAAHIGRTCGECVAFPGASGEAAECKDTGEVRHSTYDACANLVLREAL